MSRLQLTLVVPIASVLVLSCKDRSSQNNTVAEHDTLTNATTTDVYLVYSAVVRTFFGEKYTHSSKLPDPLVILSQTYLQRIGIVFDPSVPEEIELHVPQAGEDLVERFVTLNQSPLHLVNNFGLTPPPTLLPLSLVSDRRDPAGLCSSFRALYSGAPGFLELSRVAFDRGGTRALVYAALQCAYCDRGHYMLLERQGSNWVLVQDVQAWIT